MKLDTRRFRYLTQDDWRVLTAVELGSRNHTLVPTALITSLSSLRTGSSGVNHSISTLAKANLIAKVKNAKYDGYRLTYGGLDYLALHAQVKSDAVVALGSQLGVGKESDVYFVQTAIETTRTGQTSLTPATDGHGGGKRTEQCVLKLHRLGRTSFRSLKNTRAYHGNRSHCSWQYLSQLSAQKEYAAMRALRNTGLPVPLPIAHNRHTVVMSLVPGLPLRQVPLSAFGPEGSERREENVSRLYGECIELALSFADVGVIHGDFNEFNILVENVPDPDEDEVEALDHKPMVVHVIDFPQITSLSHPSASSYFARDIECINRFFRKRYQFTSTQPSPAIEDAFARLKSAQGTSKRRVDVEIEAMGFSRKMAKELEGYFDAERTDGDGTLQDSAAAEAGVEQLEENAGASAMSITIDPNDSNFTSNFLRANGISQEATESASSDLMTTFEYLNIHKDEHADSRSLMSQGIDTEPLLTNKKTPCRKQTAKAAAGWSI